MGDLHPFATRPVPYRNPVFVADLAAGAGGQWLVRIESTSSLLTPVRVWEPDAWRRHQLATYSLIAALYGGILIFLVYNFSLFLALRDRPFFFYCLYMGSVALTTFSLSGMSFQLLWPDAPNLANRIIPLLLFANLFFGTRFLQAFVRPEVQPRFFVILWRIVLVVALVLMGAALVVPYTLSIHLFSALALISVTGFVIDGILVLRRGYLPARFFLLAMSVFLTLGTVRLLMAYTVVPQNLFTEWASQIGVILEAILLSLALADRINVLEREKEQAQAEAIRNLQRADELKNEFLANTTHELRTPLNGIIGLATGCLEGTYGRLDDRQRHVIELMLTSAERLLVLINDILDFSQIREGRLRLHLEPVEVHPLIDNALEMVQPLIGAKPLRLETRIEAALPALYCDRERLRQVLYNLLSNAIKYTQAGRVWVEAYREGDRAHLRVCDTGPGMDAAQVENVMRPFERAAPGTVEGTGLGLPITRRLAEAMGGRFGLESAPGRGTCAHLWLPLATQGQRVEQEGTTLPDVHADARRMPAWLPPRTAVGPAPGKARILVVEDDPVNMRTVVDVLTTAGYLVMPVYRGKEVREAVRTFLPDLVLLDLMLPDLDGYAVCRELRKEQDSWQLPILVLTARIREEDIRRAFEDGCNDYITKPFLRKELLARIEAHLGLRSLVRKMRENDELLAEIRHRMQAESDLATAQRLLVALLDQADEGLVAFAVDGRVLGSNRAAREMLGVTDAEIRSTNLFTLVPELREIVERRLAARPGNGCGERLRLRLALAGKDEALCLVLGMAEVDDERIFHAVLGKAACEADSPRVQEVAAAFQAVGERLIHGEGPLPVSPLCESVPGEDQGETFRRLLVEGMQLALAAWKRHTGRTKVDLAEESGIWNVYIDKSTPMTRTLDKYLSLDRLPRRPRWRRVLQTIEFVLRHVPRESSEHERLVRMKLEIVQHSP
ncbi:MAG: hybrid sensor histidine kinase/response regulator [Gammaproteobacteria bacterium]|nr:MAG: hybrid sensor histidine kinase/response regulator [Gammaproteobacteria bacterium]